MLIYVILILRLLHGTKLFHTFASQCWSGWQQSGHKKFMVRLQAELQHKSEPQATNHIRLAVFSFFVPQQIRCQPYTFVGLIGMMTLNFSQPLAVQRDLITTKNGYTFLAVGKRINQQNRHWSLSRLWVQFPNKRMLQQCRIWKMMSNPNILRDAVVAVRLAYGCSNDGTNKTNCDLNVFDTDDKVRFKWRAKGSNRIVINAGG